MHTRLGACGSQIILNRAKQCMPRHLCDLYEFSMSICRASRRQADSKAQQSESRRGDKVSGYILQNLRCVDV